MKLREQSESLKKACREFWNVYEAKGGFKVMTRRNRFRLRRRIIIDISKKYGKTERLMEKILFNHVLYDPTETWVYKIKYKGVNYQGIKQKEKKFLIAIFERLGAEVISIKKTT